MDEREIIDQYLRGDEKAFSLIVSQWERPLLNLALRITGDLEEAKEIRQLAFIRAFQGLSSFNGEARFSTWLFRIAVNLARDRMRSSKVQKEGLHHLASRPSPSRPDQNLEQQERSHLVTAAVNALPAAEREVLILRHFHEQSFPEIARIVGAPASTVKSRMARGLKNLKTRLKALEHDG